MAATGCAWDKVARSGQILFRRDWALIADAAAQAGIEVPAVIQGSWSHGSKSAGTHAGGGAFDLSVRKLTTAQALALVGALRERMVCAWLRTKVYGWAGDPHIHGIVADSPDLSPSARAQVAAYNRALNGLANKGRDPFPRPSTRAPFALPGQPAPVTVPKLVASLLELMTFGARNAEIVYLQRALKIRDDGYFGVLTDQAVRDDQLRRWRVCDPPRKAFVGPRQAAALGLISSTAIK